MSENSSHQVTSTEYGEDSVTRYAEVRHGNDGAHFLDPYFLKELESSKIEGKNVLDVGCGAGPWAIHAATQGAKSVYAIDNQQSMIDAAGLALQSSNSEVQGRITFKHENAIAIEQNDESFDVAISINVGCNMPSGTLHQHIQEMHRLLKKGGKAVITAPNNLQTVFVDGSQRPFEYHSELEAIIEYVNPNDPEAIKEALQDLDSILRATFVNRNGKLTLAGECVEIKVGEEIWRKLPGLVVPNFAHPLLEYIEASTAVGFDVKKRIEATFDGNLDRRKYCYENQERPLGSIYIHKAPFAVLVLEKK